MSIIIYVYYYMNIWFITPVLGALRCYSKRKILNIELFLRTPILYFLYFNIFKLLNIKNKVLWILIIERWHMLIYKTFFSFYNNDYEIKKEKYLLKYK
jgi:hypothetical protein